MASLINASTTGLGGIITTGDNSGSLALQTGGTTAITISSGQVVSLANPLPTASGGTNLSSFTSGGVVYASSTSALTTGSALTFDGTTLAVTGTLTVKYTSNGTTPTSPAQAGLNLWGDSSVRLLFGTYSGSPYAAYIQTSNTGNPSVFPLALNPNGGNVGIGISSPQSQLDVNITFQVSRASTFTGAWTNSLTYTSAADYGSLYQTLTLSTGNYVWNIGVGSEKMRLTNAGRLGVGKTSPNSLLDVSGCYEAQNATLTSGSTVDIPITAGTGNAVLMLVLIASNGNGNANSSALLLVNTRSWLFGGGNSPALISSTQGSTGTSNEPTSQSYILSGSGSNVYLRVGASCTSGNSFTVSTRMITVV